MCSTLRAWPGCALDLHYGEAGRGAGFVIPHAEHVGNAAGIKRTPYFGAPGDAFEQPGFIRGFLLRRAARYRIVAMQDGFDVEVRARHGVVGASVMWEGVSARDSVSLTLADVTYSLKFLFRNHAIIL